MKRKLIKQGGGGYTFYVPKKWVDFRGLKAGDEVEVEEAGDSLVIRGKKFGKKDFHVTIKKDQKEYIFVILTHIYRMGFDTIRVDFEDDKLLPEIERVVKDLMLGFEMTERCNSYCVIENITEPTDEKFDVLLRRIFLLIKEMQGVIVQDFKSGKFKNLRVVKELRDKQDKFIYFCRRILTKKIYREKYPNLLWELLTFLMHINHAYYYLYVYASKKVKSKVSKSTLELLDIAQNNFRLYYDSFFKKDLNSIHKLNELKNPIIFGKCYDAIEKAKGSEAVVVASLREILRLIQIGASPIQSILVG